MSIFSEQLQFKPLTPERRRLLRMEVNLLGLLLLTVAFLTIFEFCKVEVGAFLRSILSPILQPILAPLGAFIQAYILVPLRDFIALVHIDRIWLQCFAQFMTFVGKFIGHCVEVLAPFLPPALLIARHIGLVGWKNFGREESVLTHEIKRRLLAWFEPRIEIRMDRRTLLSELSGLMVLIVVTYAACFLILSGLATNFLPGEFWPMLDHGIGNWTIACLHDAKLSVPHAWIEYLSLYQSSLTVDPAKALFDWRTYFDVSHMFRAHIPVPSDFAAYRLFVGFIGSLLMAIPTTLLLVCIGIDDLLVKRLIITPTRLLHGWRFLYLFSLTRTYLWRN